MNDIAPSAVLFNPSVNQCCNSLEKQKHYLKSAFTWNTLYVTNSNIISDKY